MAIDLLVRERNNNGKIIKARRVVVAITTVVLVVYVLAAAGFVGWWYVETSRVKKTTASLDSLAFQLKNQSEKEVMVRKVAERAGMVNTFLETREQAAEKARLADNGLAQVIGWDISAGGVQKVKAATSSAAVVDEYAKKLTDNYNQVIIESARYTDLSALWEGTIRLNNYKK